MKNVETYKNLRLIKVPVGRGFWAAKNSENVTVAKAATKAQLKWMIDNL